MLIMEYVPNGDLLQWLRNKRQQIKLVTVCLNFFAIFTLITEFITAYLLSRYISY